MKNPIDAVKIVHLWDFLYTKLEKDFRFRKPCTGLCTPIFHQMVHDQLTTTKQPAQCAQTALWSCIEYFNYSLPTCQEIGHMRSAVLYIQIS